MSWEGWFELEGSELINTSRTEAYARQRRLSWFRAGYDNDSLGPLLGETYSTALLDNAPWVDSDDPASLDFLGYYPISVDGLEDSTRGAELIEFTDDGGRTGRIRHSPISIVFNGLLVATSDAGAEYGMRWLREITLGGPCGANQFGGDLCYLASEPYLGAEGDAEDCMNLLRRRLRKVTVPGAPTVERKLSLSDGSEAWVVQFTAVAGVPWRYAAETPVLAGFLDPAVEDPIVDPDVDYDVDAFGFDLDEIDCTEQLWGPLYDPLRPTLLAPPAPPTIPLGGAPLPSSWRRRQVIIPGGAVPLWNDVVPTITLRPGQYDARNVRLRFYSDPMETGDSYTNPCAFCGDLLVTYIPGGTTLTIDGELEQVYIDMPGGERRRAESLVLTTAGLPFNWPLLTCGTQYVFTVDTEKTATPPIIDLSLTPRIR